MYIGIFLDFCCRCRFITGCFLVLECMFFLYADVSWLWYSMMFCIPIFHDFVTMCFTSDIPWLCYYVLLYILIFHDFVTMCLLYIPIFHDFGTMCCSIYRYSVTLLLCIVLYQDIPWLCYYVLFYITDLVCYTFFHWFFNPERHKYLIDSANSYVPWHNK